MIYVIRHGETDLNKEERIQGRSGLPLNENGRNQAEILRDKLKQYRFDLVFSSPQERAVETAEIATGIKVNTDSRLDVFDLGEADRMKKNEVKMVGSIPDPSVYDGVEEIPGFIGRIFDFMKEIENKYANKELNILISGHRCTTGCIGAYFEGIPEDRNIIRFSSGNGKFKVYEFNQNKIFKS
ncbi:histidine phosphatase family protein [Pseudalkalibacillus sp. R45]|uniref:histidine phosphatase family protein n=1 Tax=Pseudalkalibacillus sp. R45 TaxID=3457433 RepID=UPI003FCC2779